MYASIDKDNVTSLQSLHFSVSIKFCGNYRNFPLHRRLSLVCSTYPDIFSLIKDNFYHREMKMLTFVTTATRNNSQQQMNVT